MLFIRSKLLYGMCLIEALRATDTPSNALEVAQEYQIISEVAQSIIDYFLLLVFPNISSYKAPILIFLIMINYCYHLFIVRLT